MYIKEGILPSLFFYLLLLLPVLSFLYTLLVSSQLQSYEELPKERVVRGEVISYRYTLYNKGILPSPPLRLYFPFACTRTFLLPPRTSQTFTFLLPTFFRGAYPLGLEKLEIQGLLGLYQKKRSFSNGSSLWIHPALVILDGKDPVPHYEKGWQEAGSLWDIRSYVPGDPLSKVHWKLSAKKNEWILRQFESSQEQKVLFFLDTQRLKGKDMTLREDQLIETAVALIYFYLSHETPTELWCFSHEKLLQLQGKNKTDFEKMYQALSYLSFSSPWTMKSLFSFLLLETPPPLVLLTLQVSNELYQLLCKGVQKGWDLTLIHIGWKEDIKGSLEETYLTSLKEQQVTVYQLNPLDSITTLLERGSL